MPILCAMCPSNMKSKSKFTSWGLMKEEVVLVKPSRRFLKEGQVLCLTRTGISFLSHTKHNKVVINGKDRILYLFNDSILFANIKMGDKRRWSLRYCYLHLK